MIAHRIARWRRAWSVLLVMLGIVLSLPLSAAWSGAAAGEMHRPAAASPNDVLAAKLIAAQLPLWQVSDHSLFLPAIRVRVDQ